MRDRVPASPWRLIGREREIDELRALLAEGARLTTLTGPGGSGKTRLALALAESIADEFASSAFVDLSGIRDPSLVPQTIASTLEASRGTGTAFEAIARHIGENRVLLLVDNFEQLLPESAVVSDLLTACPSLVILATSRAPLELRWERVYPVGPLEIPPEGARRAAEVRGSAAVALFCERARAVRPLFSLNDATAPAASAIVRRLDGLPLAIELAAARLRTLSVDEVAARIGSALDLLTRGEHDRPARQRTIRATIDWSLDLLSDRQHRLLRRMAVFEGGASLDAVGAVAVEASDVTTLDDVEALVQAGIVMSSETIGETRVRLPATVRERALELLRESGEHDAVADAHARFFAAFAARGEEELTGADAGTWYARFEAERENLRAAMGRSLGSDAADHEPGMAIVAKMLQPWYAQGGHEEALRWIDLALKVGGASPHRLQVLCNGGAFAHQTGDVAKAERDYRQVLELSRRDGPPRKEFAANVDLGKIARDRGDEAAARAFYAEAFRLVDKLDLPAPDRCLLESAAGECLRWYGDADGAKAQTETALRHARECGSPQSTVACLTTLAELARARRDLDGAEALLGEAWRLVHAMGHRVLQRRVLAVRILVACDLGDPARAAELCWQSIRIAREAGDRTAAAAYWIDALAYTASALAHHEDAARLFAHADALRAAIGAVVPPVARDARARAVAAIDAVVGRRAHGALTVTDASLSTVFSLAERLFAPAQAPAVALSRREREVAALVVRGLSNRAIADRLVLGERTVETHVERVLRKLDVSSRHSVAARAEELALSL